MRIDMRTRPMAGPPNGRYYRVLLDKQDVTDRCFLADDLMGVVGLYLWDASGHFYRDDRTGDAAQEFCRGQITLIPPEPAAESVADSKELIAS